MGAVKELLDELARLKFNRFYWPADKIPATFYTPEQMLEIRNYAEARHIRLLSATTAMPIFSISDTKQMLDVLNLGQSLVIPIRSQTTPSPEQLYRSEPIPDQLPETLRPQILGVDYVHRADKTTTPTGQFSQSYQHLAAAAEVAWTFAQNKDFERFKAGLAGLYKDRAGVPAVFR